MSNEIPNLHSEKDNNSLLDKYNHYEKSTPEEKAWGILTTEIAFLNTELNSSHSYIIKDEVRVTENTDSQKVKIGKVKEHLKSIVEALEQLEKPE